MTEFIYTGRVPEALRRAALECFELYRRDREPYIARMRDNEEYYRSFYERLAATEKRRMDCTTPLLFSCIENAAADASSNYPVPNILERDPEGTRAAEALSKLLPVQLEMSRFRRVYAANTMNKLKHGTAVYGVFYNGATREIDIRSVDLMDVYVDAHLENVQDSRFVFISAAVDNDVLKAQYPRFGRLFTGDTVVDGISGSYTLTNRSEVLDCYYKKPDGTLHMMKLCKNVIIEATEDMDGYENGLYEHGRYPIVFDVLYPIRNCPFGFGMLDIGKGTQIEIDKLDNAITRNVILASKQRYFSKRNSGINIDEFTDINNDVIHVDGDIEEALRPLRMNSINTHPITHRENKKEELKELLANRDFQQGQTSGGVTAASAIKALRETGEKRARKTASEMFETYKEIIYMCIGLIRQFYTDRRTFRVDDGQGGKEFIGFSSDMLRADDGIDPETGLPGYREIRFDIEVVPQTESPYTREQQNETMLTFWNSGFFLPENRDAALAALRSLDFKGKGKLIKDIKSLGHEAEPTAKSGQKDSGANDEGLVPIAVSGGVE